ncbi:hypothetical protein Tco_0136098, partial [Tanacetum coccineum]
MRGIANDVIQRMIFGPSSEMIWRVVNLVDRESQLYQSTWLGSAALTFPDDDCAEPGSPVTRLCLRDEEFLGVGLEDDYWMLTMRHLLTVHLEQLL